MELFGTSVIGPDSFKTVSSGASNVAPAAVSESFMFAKESREVSNYMTGNVPQLGSRVAELVSKMVF